MKSPVKQIAIVPPRRSRKTETPQMAAPQAAERPRLASPPPQWGQPESFGFRILIADDHADTRDLYAFGLQRFGFNVAIASNGRDALDMARQAPHPDCVVLDLRMPELDGCAVIRQLRAQAATRTIAAIAISGDLTRKGEAYDAGFDAFCFKPCPPDQVILQVIKLLLPRATSCE